MYWKYAVIIQSAKKLGAYNETIGQKLASIQTMLLQLSLSFYELQSSVINKSKTARLDKCHLFDQVYLLRFYSDWGSFDWVS